MKSIKSIFLFILVIGLLASCTNRRYGQMTRFNHHPKEVVEKTRVEPIHKNNPKFSAQEVAPEKAIVVQTENQAQEVDKVNNTFAPEINLKEKLFVNPASRQIIKSIAKSNATAKAEMNRNPNQSQINQIALSRNEVLKNSTAPKDDASNLLYWILVIILVLLILTLLRAVLGPLYPILALVVVIILIGHLIDLW